MFGKLAVVLGFLSFAGVVGHFFVGPVDPPPPIEVSIAEKAVNIRDATVAALKGEEYEVERKVQPRTLDDYLTYSFIAMAVVAMLMSVIGFVKHERLRPGIAGAALGGLAITFQVATIVFFGLLCAIVLAAVIEKLGFDT
ncbi:MAG: hypothetical protein ACFHX7_15730 [Pseudomonadota bacterium]